MWGVLVYIYVGSIYIYYIGYLNWIIFVIIVIEMVKDGRLKWIDCRFSFVFSKWYCKNRVKYICICFVRFIMF